MLGLIRVARLVFAWAMCCSSCRIARQTSYTITRRMTKTASSHNRFFLAFQDSSKNIHQTANIFIKTRMKMPPMECHAQQHMFVSS